MNRTDRPDYAGKTVTVETTTPLYGMPEDCLTYKDFWVDGYWDEITGRSWKLAGGNPAAMGYVHRATASGLPLDDDVLYGHYKNLGYLVHVSEVHEAAESGI